MPLYEFECEKCGARFERILRFTDPLPEACPECGGKPHKLPSAPSFQFKGTGWYVTDYAKKSGSPSSESKGEKTEASKADASKTESKPSEKSEKKTEPTSPAAKSKD